MCIYWFLPTPLSSETLDIFDTRRTIIRVPQLLCGKNCATAVNWGCDGASRNPHPSDTDVTFNIRTDSNADLQKQ